MKHLSFLFLAILLMHSKLAGQEIKIEKSPKRLGDPINSSAEEVQPLLSSDGSLYFVRTFHEQNIGGVKGGQDIWLSKKESDTSWQAPYNLTELNNAYNNAVVGVSKDNNTIYLLNTYSNPLRWKYGISVVEKLEEGLSKIKELPIVFGSKGDLRGYYVSPSEDVILVSSESEDSFGQEDIYLYHKSDEKWNGPIHLNDKINTELSEISPFITEDHKTLFFASQGHNGLGNFDIYSSERIDDSWENWSPAKNLGSPINTSRFDGYFSTYEDGTSFYVSKVSESSTDIYTAKIRIELKGIKNDFLAYSDQLRKDFRRALIQDTTLHGKVFDISEATSEDSHNLSNVLKGDDIFNKRLLGVEERDSLINLYAFEQLNDDLTTTEYDKRKLWNRALSEDIRIAVDRNFKVDEKLRAIPLNPLDESSLEKDLVIQNLKTSIAQKMVENATLKQEISELVAQNSLNKHNYTQFYEDQGTREFSEDKILTNNDLLEKKMAEWYDNLAEINRKTDELVQATSEFEVYLSANTKRSLSENSSLNNLNGVLREDSSINEQILSLGAKNPELIQIVDQLISNNSTMTGGLLEIQVDDSLINEYVQKMSGLQRDSKEYEEISQSISMLLEDITNITNSNEKLSPESILLAEGNKDSLTLDLTDKIAKEIEIKQNISELILKNDLLKQNLLNDSDGGDSTTLEIKSIEVAIEQELKKLQEAIVAVENSSLEVEKKSAPQLYAEHILQKNTKAISEFDQLLSSSNDLNKGITQINTLNREIDPKLVQLTSKNVSLNKVIAETDSEYLTANREIMSLTKEADSLSTNLKKYHEDHKDLDRSISSSVEMNKKLSKELVIDLNNFKPKKPATYAGYEKDIAGFLAKNNQLKQEILALIDKNASTRQKMLQSELMDTTMTAQMSKNTVTLKQKTEELENNINAIQDRLDNFNEELALEGRINEILTRYDELNKLINQAISIDTAASASISESIENKPPSKSSKLIASNKQLDSNLGLVNGLYLRLNQNILKHTTVAAKSKESSSITTKNVDISSQIAELDNTMSAIIQESDSLSTMKEDSLSAFLDEIMTLKKEIASLIGHNSSFKMYLDTTDFLATDIFFVEMIESNNDLIYDKVRQWTDLLNRFNTDGLDSEIALLEESEIAKDTKIEGYAIQVLAMPNGVKPLNNAYLDQLKTNEIKKSVGKDGLDRYYFGKYKRKKDALKAMKSLRSSGYKDAFVRAIVKYNELGKGPSSEVMTNDQPNRPNEKSINVQVADDVVLLKESELSKNTEINGYAVQLLAMPDGRAPINSYLEKLDIDEIKKSKGKDGLDRYYIGKYRNKKEALRAMRSIRAKGYNDAFVRAIVKYDML